MNSRNSVISCHSTALVCAFLSRWCCVSKANAGEPSCNSSAKCMAGEDLEEKSEMWTQNCAYALPVVLVNLDLLFVEFLIGSGLGKARQGLGSGISPPEQPKWESVPRNGLWLVVVPAMCNPTASFLRFLYLLIYLLCLSHDVALSIHICSNQASLWTHRFIEGNSIGTGSHLLLFQQPSPKAMSQK